MFKGTPDIIAQRREEIVNACDELYKTMSFKDITLKEIGKVTSFSRPTIYNYFQTKEEIFWLCSSGSMTNGMLSLKAFWKVIRSTAEKSLRT